jgi:hypothetical protein
MSCELFKIIVISQIYIVSDVYLFREKISRDFFAPLIKFKRKTNNIFEHF